MRRAAAQRVRIAAMYIAAALVVGTAHAEEAPVADAEAGDVAGSDSPSSAEAAARPTPQPTPLFELLDLVAQGLEVERTENRLRIEQFIQGRADQERLLSEAHAILATEEARSEQLEAQYNENEVALAGNEARLKEQLGQLGELFGVVRQVATDASGLLWDSLTSSQLGPRNELLDRLGRSTELPSTEDLKKLWYELHREMTEQGQVVRYRASILTLVGRVEEREVVRAGPFSAISGGRYLLWEPAQGKLRELTRQPPAQYLNTVEPFEQTTTGFARLAVDPSRGSLLDLLTETPSRIERVQQGGYVGYTIITLGVLAGLVGLIRLVALTITSRKVAAQIRSDRPDPGNPWAGCSRCSRKTGRWIPRCSSSSSTRRCCASRPSSSDGSGW